MSKQDEKLRQRRRLQDKATDLAAKNRWSEAVELNRQILEVGEDTEAYNRLGKAYFEMGNLRDAYDAYQNALRITPTNGIARRNVERLTDLLSKTNEINVRDRAGRELVDMRLFITEIGKTAISVLIDVSRQPFVETIVTGERVELRVEGRNVFVFDVDGNQIGRLEPKLAQRLSELMSGGNRYMAAVAQTSGNQIRILIRETYQDPSQRNRISFPGKFGEGVLRGYMPSGTYDEFGEDMLEDEETLDDVSDTEEETFGGEEEELGLDDIEPDIGDDDDMNEE